MLSKNVILNLYNKIYNNFISAEHEQGLEVDRILERLEELEHHCEQDRVWMEQMFEGVKHQDRPDPAVAGPPG